MYEYYNMYKDKRYSGKGVWLWIWGGGFRSTSFLINLIILLAISLRYPMQWNMLQQSEKRFSIFYLDLRKGTDFCIAASLPFITQFWGDLVERNFMAPWWAGTGKGDGTDSTDRGADMHLQQSGRTFEHTGGALVHARLSKRRWRKNNRHLLWSGKWKGPHRKSGFWDDAQRLRCK